MFDSISDRVSSCVPLVLGLAAQAWVKRSFADGSKIQASSGLTGAQVSQRMLDASGIHDVSVEGISGQLSDHYDPRAKTMRLSEPVGRLDLGGRGGRRRARDRPRDPGRPARGRFPASRRARAGRRVRVQRMVPGAASWDSSS